MGGLDLLYFVNQSFVRAVSPKGHGVAQGIRDQKKPLLFAQAPCLALRRHGADRNTVGVPIMFT